MGGLTRQNHQQKEGGDTSCKKEIKYTRRNPIPFFIVDVDDGDGDDDGGDGGGGGDDGGDGGGGDDGGDDGGGGGDDSGDGGGEGGNGGDKILPTSPNVNVRDRHC